MQDAPEGGEISKEPWAVDLMEKSSMTAGEIEEACALFHQRVEIGTSDCGEALTIEDVDLLLRQLRLFMSVRFLWSLFREIDDNINGKVELSEFVWMVAKLRGRSSMSSDFYIRSLPRTVKDRFVKVFEILSMDNAIDKEDLVTACRQLNGHVDTDSDEFRKALDELTDLGGGRYGVTDFLVLQAKLRKPPPEIDVALMSLTEEETERFSASFKHYAENAGTGPTTPQELRALMNQTGMMLPLDQIRRLMASVELDGSRPMELREFLYVLVNLGAGTSDEPRRILLPGSSYEEAFDKGFPLDELWELGYDDLVSLRRAGWSAQSVMKAGLAEPFQLRQVGYSAIDLRKIGCSAKQLKLAGFSLEELRNAGFSAQVLHDCCSVLMKNRAQRPDVDSGLTLRPVTEGGANLESGANQGEMRWWSTPRIQSLLDSSGGETAGKATKNTVRVKTRPVAF